MSQPRKVAYPGHALVRLAGRTIDRARACQTMPITNALTGVIGDGVI
jgi:hypothetical protein